MRENIRYIPVPHAPHWGGDVTRLLLSDYSLGWDQFLDCHIVTQHPAPAISSEENFSLGWFQLNTTEHQHQSVMKRDEEMMDPRHHDETKYFFDRNEIFFLMTVVCWETEKRREWVCWFLRFYNKPHNLRISGRPASDWSQFSEFWVARNWN